MTFGNSILGSAGTLIRRAIRSAAYIAGVSGWSIERDGSAEFNGTVIARSFHTGDPANNDKRVTVRNGNGSDVEFFLDGKPALSGRLRLVKQPFSNPPKWVETIESTTAVASTTHTVNLPTPVAGDKWIFVGTWNVNNTITHTPALFTNLASNAMGNGQSEVWIRDVDGTEGATTTFTSSTSDQGSFQVIRVSGTTIGLVSGTDYNLATNTATNTLMPDPPSVTAGWGIDENLFLVLLSTRPTDAAVSAYPANYSNGTDTITGNGNPNGATAASATRVLTAATDDPATFTITKPAAPTDKTIAHTLVLRPSATGETDEIIFAMETDDIHPTSGRPRIIMFVSDDATRPAVVLVGFEGGNRISIREDSTSLGDQVLSTTGLASSATAGTPIHINASNQLFKYTGP